MYKQDAFLPEEASTLKRPPSALLSITESNRSWKMHNKQNEFDTSRDQRENEAIVSASAGSGNHTISLKQPIVSDNSLYTAATTICTTTKYITNIPSAKTTTKTHAPSSLPLSSSYTYSQQEPSPLPNMCSVQQHGTQHHQHHVLYNNSSYSNDEYHKYYQQEQFIPPPSSSLTSSSAYYNNPDELTTTAPTK